VILAIYTCAWMLFTLVILRVRMLFTLVILAVHRCAWKLFTLVILCVWMLFTLVILAVQTCTWLRVTRLRYPTTALASYRHTHTHSYSTLQHAAESEDLR